VRAYIVVDLGFGDSGKGLLTDYLTRHFEAGVVVRYNGGAQAGHNVVAPDGRHHTFSQFGSGTFIPGVKTYLSRQVIIHPGALLVEGTILEKKGIPDAFSRLRVSDQALVITPYHQAANRIKEIVRGSDRHGSCGVGVGEAVEDALLNPDGSVLAGDLLNPITLRRKLRSIRDQKRLQLYDFCRDTLPGILPKNEWEIFDGDDVIDSWISSISRIGDLELVVSDSLLEKWFQQTETVIFEGAQGVLLDADEGFHPFTTWSRCTAENAFELITEMAPGSNAFRMGVLRSYAVRHGPGPLPTETSELASVVKEHNQTNDWQGAVRYGWFDSVLTRYALGVNGGIDSLAVTHMDVLPHLENWRYCSEYQGLAGFEWSSVASTVSQDILTGFPRHSLLSLSQRAQFTQALFNVKPTFETCAANQKDVIQTIESQLGKQIDIISNGACAKNIQLLHSIPS
jgi:adenylosuccinate synthase